MASGREAVLAVDIGGTWVRLALVDPQGEVLASGSFPTQGEPQQAMERLASEVARLRGEVGPFRLQGVGVSTAGPLDLETGRLTHPPNLPRWDGFSPAEDLTHRLGVPAVVGHDAALAALGEYLYGVGRGRRHLLFLIWGTGIGGGLLLDGRLYRGATGKAGEVGHIVLDPEGPLCGCGGRGCWEALAAGPALARRARDLLATGGGGPLRALCGGQPQALTAEMVVEADRQGDPMARRAIEETARWMGRGLASLRNALDPEVIVLGGGVARSLHGFFPLLLRAAREHSIAPQKGCFPLVPSALDPQAGLLGASALAWSRLGRLPLPGG